MTHLLRITDGTITVTLSSGDIYLSSYIPQVISQDGYIQDSAVIGFSGAMATNRANIQSINRLLMQAHNYARSRTGARVYMEFDPDTSGTVYRSRLYSGAVEMTDGLLGNQWGSGTLELNLSFVRDAFWEGPLTQIPLANTSTTDIPSTNYVTIYNRNDATGYNWVTIASTDVLGDMPAPFKLEMISATDSTSPTDLIYLWHNVYSAPLAFDHWLEGESSTDAVSTTDSASSGLAYGAFSWSTTDETKFGEWTIPSSDLDNAAGGHFALLARWKGLFPYTGFWLRVTLETPTTYGTLYRGDLQKVAPTTDIDNIRELKKLDTLQLPPALVGQTGIENVILRLYGLRSSTDNDINIDWLQLSPISGDAGWKGFKAVDSGIAAGETFVHDATEYPTNLDYRIDSSSKKSGKFSNFGGPILLIPNYNQRLYINTCDSAGFAVVTQSWRLKLYYRPRRSSL